MDKATPGTLFQFSLARPSIHKNLFLLSPYCEGDVPFAVAFSGKVEEIQALIADPSQTVLWLDRVLLCPIWSFSARYFFNSF